MVSLTTRENVDLVGRAAVCVPYFAAVVLLLQESYRWICPIHPITVDLEMVWNQTADRDEGLQWLRCELALSTAGVA